MKEYRMNKLRFFDTDTMVRDIAYNLFSEIKDLPIISPHGHVDPAIFVENKTWDNPANLIIIPDHYIFRMLYSQGVNLESLGIPVIDGDSVESDPRKIWQLFSDHYYLFSGTPTGIWLDYIFKKVFNIFVDLSRDTAMQVYDELQQKLRQSEYTPRALYDRFNIEILATTDSATDRLEDHILIKNSDWKGRIIPTFRPDNVIDINSPSWLTEISRLTELSGITVDSYPRFIQALENRREYFKSLGAVATDHGVLSPYTTQISEKEAERIFQSAMSGNATTEEATIFTAHMLMEMARMSTEDGLVMQLHPGSYRKS